MQLVFRVILHQVEPFAVQAEPAIGDTVGIPARNLTHARAVIQITLLILVAQYHVSHDTIAVGNYHRHYAGASFAEHH